MSTVGSGVYTYEMLENWGSLPTGWTFGPVSAVAVEASQSSIMMVGEQIRRLSALSVPAGCSEARLFI